jgi:hypothetical protein
LRNEKPQFFEIKLQANGFFVYDFLSIVVFLDNLVKMIINFGSALRIFEVEIMKLLRD